MPELSLKDLPEVLEMNRQIKDEIEDVYQQYLVKNNTDDWGVIEGGKEYLKSKYVLLQAPIEDSSLGGFIISKGMLKICYLNTWQPRAYQNFVLFHEIYHTLTIDETEQMHIIEPQYDGNLEERKADYFASIVLMPAAKIKSFFKKLPFHYDMLTKIITTMNRFKSPYKAVLIRLLELQLLSQEDVTIYFDQRLDLETAFKKAGLDPSLMHRSLVIHFNRLETTIQENSEYPSVANEQNEKQLEHIKAYFHKIVQNYEKGCL